MKFVIFSWSQISKNLQSKHFQTFSKLIPLSLSLLSPVVVILSTRLAAILKFPYLCCYAVLITKQFNWQPGEAYVLTAKNSVHAHNNFKHQNNKPSIWKGLFYTNYYWIRRCLLNRVCRLIKQQLAYPCQSIVLLINYKNCCWKYICFVVNTHGILTPFTLL